MEISNSIKPIIRKLLHPMRRLINYLRLRKTGFVINFQYDGNQRIQIPKYGLLSFVFGTNVVARNSFKYSSRPNKEVVLRSLVQKLYDDGFIHKQKSILDVGSYLGDNAIVWTQYLEGGLVIAIDPSFDNCQFAKQIAEHNNFSNLRCIQALCSDRDDEVYVTNGDIGHSTFCTPEPGGANVYRYLVKTSKVDTLVAMEREKPLIGLMHIDVEGMEYQVLRGAIELIRSNYPVILFEGHLSKSDQLMEIFDWLSQENYRVFLINEVVPLSDLDCRNFLAVCKNSEPKIDDQTFDWSLNSNPRNDARLAFLGGPLLEVTNFFIKQYR